MEQDNSRIEGIVTLLRDVIDDYNKLSSRVENLEKTLSNNKDREKSIVLAIEHNGFPSEKILADAENIYANMV